MTSTALQPYKPGSLIDAAGGITANPQQVAMALLKARMFILCDISSSMSAEDAGIDQDESRHGTAQVALDNLQDSFPGQIAVIAFNDPGGPTAALVPTGQLPPPAGGTPIFHAMQEFYTKAMTAQVKFVLISDGEPTDDKHGCIELARQHKYPIYAIYVGPVDGSAGGRDFMERLAAESGGEFDFVHTSKMHMLEQKLAGYLTARTGEANEPTVQTA